MLNYNLDTFFPDLVGLPPHVQQEIVEKARAETFSSPKEGNSAFIWRFLGIGALSVIAALIINYFTGMSATLVLCIFGGLGAFFVVHWQQRSWARRIHPKVRELAEHYRSDKGLGK